MLNSLEDFKINLFSHIHLQWFGGESPPVLFGSRIGDAASGWEADEDQDVASWNKSEDFLVAVGVYCISGKKVSARELRLEWEDTTNNPGVWTALGAAGDLRWDGVTRLVDGNIVATTGIDHSGYTYDGTESEESEGSNSSTITLAALESTELQFAVNPSNADDSAQYTFRVWNVTDGASIGTCLAQITMAAGVIEYTGSGEANVSGIAVTSYALEFTYIGSGAVLVSGSASTIETNDYIYVGGQIGVETGGLFVIDGEDAGSDPWEFDSLNEASGNNFTLSADAANHRSNGYKGTFGGTTDDCEGWYAFADQTDVYYRFYYKINNSWSVNQITRITRFYGNASRTCFVALEPNRNIQVYHDYNGDSAWINGNTILSLNEWHCFELRWLQGSSSNGGVELWLDGVSILDDYTRTNDNYVVDQIRSGNYYGIPTAVTEFYIDDIKADTSYIGTYFVSGRVALGGAATTETIVEFIYSGSGTADIFGIAATLYEPNYEITGSGQVALSGVAVTTEINNYVYTGSGEVIVSGAASTQMIIEYIYSGSGQVTVEGGATFSHTTFYEFTASGTASVGGLVAAEYSPIFLYTASGLVQVSGEASTQGVSEFPYTGSGAVLVSGAATTETILEFIYTGSGQVTVFGAATVFSYEWEIEDLSFKKLFSHFASGGVTVSGVATTSLDTVHFEYVGSGEVVVSGAAATEAIANYIYTGSGEVVVSGVAATIVEFIYSGSGEVVVSGTATTEFVDPIYEYSGSGQIITSGAASTELVGVDIYIGSGTVTVSGSAATEIGEKHYEYSGSGEIVISGVATTSFTIVISYSGSGQIVVSGVAATTPTFDYSYVGSGEVVISGVTTTELFSADYIYSGSGQVVISGVATTEETWIFVYIGSGEVIVSGAAVTQKLLGEYIYSGSGEVVVSGIAVVSITTVPAEIATFYTPVTTLVDFYTPVTIVANFKTEVS